MTRFIFEGVVFLLLLKKKKKRNYEKQMKLVRVQRGKDRRAHENKHNIRFGKKRIVM